MKQGVLAIPSRTTCGYCLCPLEAAGEVDGHTFYECPECAQTLKTIGTSAQWQAFARDAWKRRGKRSNDAVLRNSEQA